MAALLHNEGKQVIAKMTFAGADADRGTGLQLGLFTNSSLTASSALADITEPTGGGYARIALANGSWSITAGLASYAKQTFTATGSAMTPAVYGYFICTTGGSTNRLLSSVTRDAGSFTMSENNTYEITPTLRVGA